MREFRPGRRRARPPNGLLLAGPNARRRAAKVLVSLELAAIPFIGLSASAASAGGLLESPLYQGANTALTTHLKSAIDRTPFARPGVRLADGEMSLHADPAPLPGFNPPKGGKDEFTGPLYVNGPQGSDVEQGPKDCYFAAMVSALARSRPSVIEDMIHEVLDEEGELVGYEVRFFYGQWPNVEARWVPVDRDLHFVASGNMDTLEWTRYATYGGPAEAQPAKEMELWFALLEKAWAKHLGGKYQNIDSAASPAYVYKAITGRPAQYQRVHPLLAEATWYTVRHANEHGWPLTAGTHTSAATADRFFSAPLSHSHAYTVVGHRQDDQGRRFIQLRNPEATPQRPAGARLATGVIEVPLEQFSRLVKDLEYGVL